jgi:hypothetical protein
MRPVIINKNLFKDVKAVFGIKSSQDYPFAYFTEMTMERFRTSMNSSPYSLNLVAKITPNNVSSENREVKYLVGGDSEVIVKVRESVSDNDIENGLYEWIFKEHEVQQQLQQERYVFATRRTE